MFKAAGNFKDSPAEGTVTFKNTFPDAGVSDNSQLFTYVLFFLKVGLQNLWDFLICAGLSTCSFMRM